MNTLTRSVFKTSFSLNLWMDLKTNWVKTLTVKYFIWFSNSPTLSLLRAMIKPLEVFEMQKQILWNWTPNFPKGQYRICLEADSELMTKPQRAFDFSWRTSKNCWRCWQNRKIFPPSLKAHLDERIFCKCDLKIKAFLAYIYATLRVVYYPSIILLLTLLNYMVFWMMS